MSLEFFEKICEESKELSSLLSLHILGDPFCVPHLSDFLDIATKNGLQVELTTTGVVFKQHHLQIFSHSALRQLNISLTSLFSSPLPITLESYMENIWFVCEEQQKNDFFLNLRFWNLKSNKLKILLDLLKPYFGEIQIPLLTPNQRHRIRLKKHLILELDSLFKWPSLQNPILQENGYCLGLQSHIGILNDGSVVPCCLDSEGVLNLGNIQTHSLKDILKSPYAQAIIRGFKQKNHLEDLCKRCGFIQKFSRKYQ
nr:SPASM domain-containing protein [Helicobacter sp. 15-1451]